MWLIFHWAAHWQQKNDLRSNYGWFASNTVIILSNTLLKISSNKKSKLIQSMQVLTWLSIITFHLLLFIAKLVVVDSESCITLFLSSLRTAIWSSCVIWLGPEQTRFSGAGHQSRSAALQLEWIQSRTCWFVPMHYFYPVTSESKKRFSKVMSTALVQW